MNLIFFSRRQGKARHLHLTHPATLALAGTGSGWDLGVSFGSFVIEAR